MLTSPIEALSFLKKLGAPSQLIKHLELVGEAGEELIIGLNKMEVQFDAQFVRIGIAVHDSGKILFPNELEDKGSQHEPAGEELLLKHGVQKDIARCCVSHARFAEMEVSLEELLVALSDKLWKGKRVADLELKVVDAIADNLKADRWIVFEPLDSLFEKIALKGDERLMRSQVY